MHLGDICFGYKYIYIRYILDVKKKCRYACTVVYYVLI